MSDGICGIVLAALSIMVAWIARPVLFNATFGSIIIPCLGFLFLPFTSLMYLFLLQGTGGIQGLDWLWLILAVVMDVATILAARATRTAATSCQAMLLAHKYRRQVLPRPSSKTQADRSNRSTPDRRQEGFIWVEDTQRGGVGFTGERCLDNVRV